MKHFGRKSRKVRGIIGTYVVMGFPRFLVFVAMLWVVAGCVAVDVGRPQLFCHDVKREVTDAKPRRIVLEKARAQLWQRGETAIVSLDAEVVEEYVRQQNVKQISVRRQKRLAFGLFPGAAELVWMPKGALTSAMTVKRATYESMPRYCGFYDNHDPDVIHYATEQLKIFGRGILILELETFFYTLDSLLVAPFEPWGCESHDYIDYEYWQRGLIREKQTVADASMSPRLRALAELPEELRRRIGVRTCFDVQSTGEGAGWHFGLFGFHKYLVVSVDIDDSVEDVAKEIYAKKKKVAVAGPYEVELSIPGVGHSERRIVGRGESQTAFVLPRAAQDTTIEAHVSVRECLGNEKGETSNLTKQAIRNLAGQNSRFDVNLRGTRALPGTHGRTHEIEQILPERDGKYLVRVRIADSMQIATAASDIVPDVRRLIREAYIRRHPSTRVEEIRDWVEWTVDGSNSRVLVFTGWAFSAHPVPEGWYYDAKTRRGEIRFLLSDDIPKDQAVKWARENIDAIVRDKNAVLTVGQTLEYGVQFRCIWERFENGILSIGFEDTN